MNTVRESEDWFRADPERVDRVDDVEEWARHAATIVRAWLARAELDVAGLRSLLATVKVWLDATPEDSPYGDALQDVLSLARDVPAPAGRDLTAGDVRDALDEHSEAGSLTAYNVATRLNRIARPSGGVGQPDTTEQRADDGTDLRELRIDVCENCIARKPGTCHVPGCFFIRQTVDEVPTYLELYAVQVQDRDPVSEDVILTCDDCDEPLTIGAVRVGSFRYCEDCAPDEDER